MDMIRRRLRDAKLKKLKQKKSKKLALCDELSVLRMRNFIFATTGDYTSKLVCNDRISEFKGETNLNEIMQHLQMTGKILNDESILNGLRHINLDSLVRLLNVTRSKNRDKIRNLFQKISVERDGVYGRESLFCYRLGELKKDSEGNFDNVIQPSDVLYNMKSYFPVERRYLDQLEARLRSKNATNMNKYADIQRKSHHKGDAVLMKPDDIVCQVCNSGDYSEKNLIVYCSMCNVSTHQLCYGMQKVPKDDWLCDLCVKFGCNGKYLRCWMCNCRGGVLKETSTPTDADFIRRNGSYADFIERSQPNDEPFIKDPKQVSYPVQLLYDFYKESYKFSDEELKNEPVPRKVWVHLSCALWTNELKVKDTDIRNLNKLPPHRFLKTCTICNQPTGYCIGCSYEDCGVSFHVECGRRVKLFMEIIGVGDPRFIMYCPSHTPLMLKIYIHEYERRAREDIYKYHRYLKRFLKINKINIDAVEVKERINAVESREELGRARKPKKLEPEDLVRFLEPDMQHFIRDVRRELFKMKDYSSVIDISVSAAGEYRIDKINFPKKNLFKGKIASSSIVWKSLAKRYNKTAKSMYNKFIRVLSMLKSFEGNTAASLQPGTDVKAQVKAEESLFEPNNENFDDEIYCICKKEWKGELMIECDRCAKWYHPQCINVDITNEVEINNNHILCNRCTDEYTKDYGINIEIVNNDGNSTVFKFRKNSCHAEPQAAGDCNDCDDDGMELEAEDNESDCAMADTPRRLETQSHNREADNNNSQSFKDMEMRSEAQLRSVNPRHAGDVYSSK